MHFTEAEIATIKSTVKLQDLVDASDITLKKHGKDLVGHCPFHNDKTPSLVITPDKNLWHCLGACQTGGSVIDWVMKESSCSFIEACEYLQRYSNNKAAPTPSYPKPDITEGAPDNNALMKRVIEFYHKSLKQSPEALDYLTRRGLNDPKLINHFKLGYANRELFNYLPKNPRKGSRECESRQKLKRLGLLRETGHEHFNGSLIIPVMNKAGDIKEIYGRKIIQNLRKGTPLHLYLPGPHCGVFNEEALECYETIILCESLIDALTFYRHGFCNVTTSYGISGFTDTLYQAFKKQPVKQVYIAYDRDEAGEAGTERVAKKLSELGITCYRLLFPKGMDVNEYALHALPPKASLEAILRNPEWLCHGKDKEAPNSCHKKLSPPVTDFEEPKEQETATEKREDPNNADTKKNINNIANPPPSLVVTQSEQEITIALDERLYRIRGLSNKPQAEHLKINLFIQWQERFHIDNLDLYCAKHRVSFCKQAAHELNMDERVIKQDLGRLILQLETLQENHNQKALDPGTASLSKMTDEELKESLAFLQAPNLIERLQEDFECLGLVGEDTNKLIGYLAATSRKLARPLAVMVQSSSAAGKSSLMDNLLKLMPPEEHIHFSAMTGQALFYMSDQDLKHKILSIAEEEGAQQTAYALKLLQSEGEVSIASTGKNPSTGNLETQTYRVEGPVMLFSTTTAIDIDEELMNRCLVLSIDESREQTEAIHQAQRTKRTLKGLKATADQESCIKRHQHAQRLLRPLAVINPYADKLTFQSDKTRTRRDHEKYLTLIDTIALLHQHQREIKAEQYNGKVLEYIEVTLEDIALANKLAHEALGRTLDELPPQTRRLLNITYAMVREATQTQGLRYCDYRFSRKTLRNFSGFSDFQIKKHLTRLVELEYVLVHKGKRGQSYAYELLYSDEDQVTQSVSAQQSNLNQPSSSKYLLGLLDPTVIQALDHDAKLEPLTPKLEPPSSPQSAPLEPPEKSPYFEEKALINSLKCHTSLSRAYSELIRQNNKSASCTTLSKESQQ